MSPALRFITDLDAPAAFHMAADLHLLAAAAACDVVTVRFYTWQPTTITLGQAQAAADVLDLDAMARDGIAWIRRPTGGRAVLHREDLTYSVTFGRHLTGMGHTVTETYRIIADCLTRGLALAGIRCQTHDSDLDTALVKRETKLPCFLAPNRDEIMVEGRKLVGSAQKRTAQAVLQHGSIPITGAFRRIPLYSRITPERQAAESRLLKSKCTCVQECAAGVSIGCLAGSLEKGFAHVLRMAGRVDAWSREERAAIDRLAGDAAFREQCLSPTTSRQQQ